MRESFGSLLDSVTGGRTQLEAKVLPGDRSKIILNAFAFIGMNASGRPDKRSRLKRMPIQNDLIIRRPQCNRRSFNSVFLPEVILG